MGTSFPKPECLTNCLDRVAFTCEDRFLKRPEGLPQAKVEQQCREECQSINEVMRITHVSDAFVSSLADSFCGGPRGSGKKSGHYSLEIRGTNGGTSDTGPNSGTKAPKLARRLAIAEEMLRIAETMRDNRTWYQSVSDFLGGPQEPSRKELDDFKTMLEAAKETLKGFQGMHILLDQAIQKGQKVIGDYDQYQLDSLNHADRVKWVHLSLSVLLTVGCGATAGALALGGASATAGTAAGGAEVISIFARSGAHPLVQETLKRAAMLLFGLKSADEMRGKQ